MTKSEVLDREKIVEVQTKPYQQQLPAMTSQQFQAMWEDFQQFVRDSLVEGVDYGKVPGVDRPTLLQPGAQKIASKYFARPEYKLVDNLSIMDLEKKLILITVHCDLISMATGKKVGEGTGSCNSWEPKYRYVWVYPSQVGNRRVLEQKKFKGKDGKWYTKCKVERDDIMEIHNTILKMACKRALVSAALTLGCASGMFTQDVEDLDIENTIEEVEVENIEPQEKPKTKSNGGKSPDQYLKELIDEMSEKVDKGEFDIKIFEERVDELEKAKTIKQKIGLINKLKKDLGK